MQVNGGVWGEGGGNYYLHCLSSIYGAITVIPLYNYKFILKTAVTDGSLSPKTFISIQKRNKCPFLRKVGTCLYRQNYQGITKVVRHLQRKTAYFT